MRIYQLTDRDFEEFYALMEKIEIETRLKYGVGSVVDGHFVYDSIRRTYRCHFIGWRNRMMAGDTYSRDPEPPRDDMHKYIRREIERLKELLPKETNGEPK